jgi:Co/Zn/Cd efflux system component
MAACQSLALIVAVCCAVLCCVQVISGMEGVRDVHDLHIWNISTSTSPVLTAHVHIGPDADANVVLQKLEEYVRGVGIQHSTIQICNPLQLTA